MATKSETATVAQLHITIQVKDPELLPGLFAILAPHAKLSLEETGVGRFDMALVPAKDPPAMMLLETYHNYPKDFDNHAATERFNRVQKELQARGDHVTATSYKTLYPTPEYFKLDASALPHSEDDYASACSNGCLKGVIVDIQVAQEVDLKTFIDATIENCRNSRDEVGIARFDLLQKLDDEYNFALVEIYHSDEAPAAHKATSHYQVWRSVVEGMMARPRSATKIQTLFPKQEFWSS